MTKIKLLVDVPVEDKHNMVAGRVLDVLRFDLPEYKKLNSAGAWVQGDGEEVKILSHEYETVLKDE